jgi:hypothetical protein
MNRTVGQNKSPANGATQLALRKKGARDADILLVVWEIFRTRVGEIDNLLDLSLSIVSTAPDFPQKNDLETSLKKALFSIRNFA